MYDSAVMNQVARQGREIRILCEDAQIARRIVRALGNEALRALEIVGAAQEQGEGAELRVVWKEGEDWPPKEAA